MHQLLRCGSLGLTSGFPVAPRARTQRRYLPILCISLVHVSQKSLNTLFGVWNRYPWHRISWSRSRSLGLCHSSSDVFLPCRWTSINTAALIISISSTTTIVAIRAAFHLDFALPLSSNKYSDFILLTMKLHFAISCLAIATTTQVSVSTSPSASMV